VSPHGVFRWLSRVWKLTLSNAERVRTAGPTSGQSELRRRTHRAIDGVTTDFERYRFNTAISKLMVLSNDIGELAAASSDDDVAEAIGSLLKMLAPFAPFITEELWNLLGGEGSIHRSSWPEVERSLTVEETVTLIVQVNGKVRDRIEVPAGIGSEELQERAMASEKVRGHVEGKTIQKVIVVPPKLVNVVVR
jgi:leucyl-tRNA synthetase